MFRDLLEIEAGVGAVPQRSSEKDYQLITPDLL
ncbi:MAG: hypothetical protein QOE55_3166, partial [Acidobacteriaceae bacterium]|nr:hypothetical protein [Acidobacteriaceae bacterium]